jgi:hypothetical protein
VTPTNLVPSHTTPDNLEPSYDEEGADWDGFSYVSATDRGGAGYRNAFSAVSVSGSIIILHNLLIESPTGNTD